jgi:hypothetical protein
VPEWVRLFEDPGEPVNVREVVGQYGQALDRFGSMRAGMIVANERDDAAPVNDDLVGLVMHPDLEGVAVAATPGTPAGEAERLTAVLRELGWRWATREEVLGLAGYLVPGLGGAPRATDGSTRTWVLRDLT